MVDFPINSVVILHGYVSHYQRIIPLEMGDWGKDSANLPSRLQESGAHHPSGYVIAMEKQ